MLKILSNGRFLPIALDEKRKEDRRSLGGAKVGGAFFEDALLIIPLHWLSLWFSGIGVGICEEDHIEKSGGTTQEERATQAYAQTYQTHTI